MKKIFTLSILSICLILLQSGVTSLNFSGQPPTGRTGATGSYCTGCHSDNTLNTGGGGIVLTGIPLNAYTPSTQYTLSLQIFHGAANRTKWGFSLRAQDGTGASIGTFASSNANAAPNGNELSHNNAVSTTASSSFTYTNLKWTSPATTGPITIYYVGNAADGTGGTDGDFIYAGSTNLTLPIDLKDFYAINDNNNILLKWQTTTEINSNYFDVERSDDGQFFFSIGKVDAVGNSSNPVSYSFLDTKASYNNGSQIFYRLKQVDKDGSIKYSNHINVKPIFTGITVKNIYPTIIKKSDVVSVEIASDKSREINIVVMDESGRSLQLLKTNLNIGNNKITFTPRVNDLKGMLFIKFVTTNFQQTKTLILQ